MSSNLMLKKDDIINFDMIRPGIFGDQYKGAIVDGIIGFNSARYIDPEIFQKHANFYPFFKDKVDNVDDPQVYDYLSLRLNKMDPKLTIIGIPWINQDTLKTIQSRHATVIIQHFQEFHRAPLNDFLKNLNVTYTLTVDDDV